MGGGVHCVVGGIVVFSVNISYCLFNFFEFNHWPGVNFTFKFGIYDRVRGGSIVEGGSIISSSIGGMIVVSQ